MGGFELLTPLTYQHAAFRVVMLPQDDSQFDSHNNRPLQHGTNNGVHLVASLDMIWTPADTQGPI